MNVQAVSTNSFFFARKLRSECNRIESRERVKLFQLLVDSGPFGPYAPQTAWIPTRCIKTELKKNIITVFVCSCVYRLLSYKKSYSDSRSQPTPSKPPPKKGRPLPITTFISIHTSLINCLLLQLLARLLGYGPFGPNAPQTRSGPKQLHKNGNLKKNYNTSIYFFLCVSTPLLQKKK